MKKNVNQTYSELLQNIIENGVRKEDKSRNTYTLSLFGQIMRMEHLYEPNSFPLLTTKKVYHKGIVAELIWFLKGDTNIKYLVDNNVNIWNLDAYNYYKQKSTMLSGSEFFNNGTLLTLEQFINKIKSESNPTMQAGYKLGDLGKAYGKQWRCFNSNNYVVSDQIANLLNSLYNNPFGRRQMVTAWNPSEVHETALPPCHTGFLCNVFEKDNQKYLDLKFEMRSNDFCAGNPYNIASYGILLMVLAEILEYRPNDLIASLGDTHVYAEHIENAKIQLERETNLYPSPNLVFSSNAKGVFKTINSLIRSNQLSTRTLDNELGKLKIEDFVFENYESYPKINYDMLAPIV